MGGWEEEKHGVGGYKGASQGRGIDEGHGALLIDHEVTGHIEARPKEEDEEVSPSKHLAWCSSRN